MTIAPPLCPETLQVDAHFAGSISPSAERSMREHLVGCATCRARYERQALLASLDPDALGAEDRIGQALGLPAMTIERVPPPAARPAAILRARALAVSALALAASLLLLLRPPNQPNDDASAGGFHPRGSIAASDATADRSPLVVFRVRPGSPELERAADGTLGRTDELAFAYENVDHLPYLMIFGVDAHDPHGKVYWFFPAWTDVRDAPLAIPADPSGGIHALGEAVRHPFATDRIELHALFLASPLDVRTVETAVARRGPSGRVELASAVDHVVTVEIRR